jgi:hypothetical protein
MKLILVSFPPALISHIKAIAKIDGAGEQGAGVNTGVQENEVTVRWRKLHNEELHYLYSSIK